MVIQMKVLAGMSEFIIGYGLWLCGAIIALTVLIRFPSAGTPAPAGGCWTGYHPGHCIRPYTGELSVQYFIHAAD